jgi:hypothetical protein
MSLGLDKTTGQRATAAVFLGYSEKSNAYVCWNHDQDEFLESTEVEFFPNSFPVRDLLLAGERRPQDGLENLDNWRSSGHFALEHVEPKRLAEYLIHKAVHFDLAEEYAIRVAPFKWTVVPVKAVKRQQNSCIDLVCQATHFSGDIHELTLREQKFKELPLIFNVAIEGTATYPSIPDMLKTTYPQARLLYDFAKHSSDLHGLAPLPLRLQNQPASFSKDFNDLAREFEDLPNRFLQALSDELAPAPQLRMNQGERPVPANDFAPGPLPALRQDGNDNGASSSSVSQQSSGSQADKVNGPLTRAKARRAGRQGQHGEMSCKRNTLHISMRYTEHSDNPGFQRKLF